MNIETPRKKHDLASAIAEGDIRVLLMVLVHMTGDERWLEPPYKPRRDVRLIPDPEAGLPKEIQDEIRAAVVKLFADGEPKSVVTDPGDELMLRMMRATLGENVTPEYAPLIDHRTDLFKVSKLTIELLFLLLRLPAYTVLAAPRTGAPAVVYPFHE